MVLQKKTINRLINVGISSLLLVGATQLNTLKPTDTQVIYACSTTAECQKEIEEAQKKRGQLQEEQKSLEKKSADAEAQIKNIINQIESYSVEITAVNIELTNLAAQHDALIKSITEKEETIKKRMFENQLSTETNKAMQFIANSSSITEMIERIQAINAITESDQNLIRLYEEQKKQVEKNEAEQKQRRETLEKLVAEQKELQKSKQVELETYLKEMAHAKEAQQEALRDEQLSQSQLAAIERARNAAPTITSGTALQNEKAAFAYFVSQGYTKAAAAGIIGNFYVESGMDPGKSQYGGGPGRGIGQWGYGADGGRYNQLLAWAAKNGLSPSDLGTQLAWTVKEMIAYGMDSTMKSINDVSAATEYFGRVWERPACLACSLSLRISYAQQAYKRNA